MYKLSKTAKRSLYYHVYDEIELFLGNSVRRSTIDSFKNHKFYKKLPPRLKQDLVRASLYRLENKAFYFFNDLQFNIEAPKLYITKILSALSSLIVPIGENVRDIEKSMSYLYLLLEGDATLVGYDFVQGTPVKFNVVKLPEGSWFGDYQIFRNQKSIWDLVSSPDPKKSSSHQFLHIKVFLIKATYFLEILKIFPRYHDLLLLRATTREAYWR